MVAAIAEMRFEVFEFCEYRSKILGWRRLLSISNQRIAENAKSHTFVCRNGPPLLANESRPDALSGKKKNVSTLDGIERNGCKVLYQYSVHSTELLKQSTKTRQLSALLALFSFLKDVILIAFAQVISIASAPSNFVLLDKTDPK